jgi:hypothetical protein
VTRPVLTFPYPSLVVRDRLRALLPDHVPGVTVSTKPTTGADESRPRPYVHVLTLGGRTVRGVRAVDVVRLNVNDPDEGDAYRIAELCRALLVADRIATGDARPDLNTDPDTGEPLASIDLDVVTAPRS